MRAFLKHPMAIALAFALACWSLLITEGAEFIYWNQYYKHIGYVRQAPEHDAVIVSIDKGRQNLVGSSADQAQVLRKVLAAGPGHVFADVPVTLGSDRNGDADFFRAVAAGGGSVDVVLRANHDSSTEVGNLTVPEAGLPQAVRAVASVWTMNFYGYAIAAPPAVQVDGRIFPSIVGNGSDRALPDRPVIPDFAFDPATVPVIPASALLSGEPVAGRLAGKTVFITATSPEFASQVGYLGQGRRPLAYVDIAGIRGAQEGIPTNAGGLPLLAALMAMIVLCQRIRGVGPRSAAYGAVVLLLLVAPPLLMEKRIIASNGPALLALLAYVPARIWQKWQHRASMTNGRSGLPNIEALVMGGIPEGFDVVAASIERFDEILSSLPRELHGECSRQIARRLSLASGDSRVYSTDSGHFVWLDEPRPIESLVAHLEGLRALFSAPLVIGDHLLDTNIHFGVDRISTSVPVRRIQAALASANEALAKGKLYEEYEERRLVEASWELSLHARIDEGLRNGDIWLALQPQLDIRTGRIAAAEALIRWSDPERGMIPPDAFILQAERAGRIEAITYWVMERAIDAAIELNRIAPPFTIAINLSARMADHPGLLERVGEIVRRRGFDCALMTIEVTETFSMANRDMARVNLAGLRDMGFRLSIDDFGTGQASLAYLAEIPSDEIKLDKRFIQMVTRDRRERLIVRTLIKLAHALGQEVVAEGIEDGATLAALKQMNCDIGQGYFIGRPARLEDLIARMSNPDLRQAG